MARCSNKHRRRLSPELAQDKINIATATTAAHSSHQRLNNLLPRTERMTLDIGSAARSASSSSATPLSWAYTVVKQLPHPISWNQWQQLHGDTFTYPQFSPAMLSHFGPHWQKSIATLPPASFVSPSFCLPQHRHIASQLPHPITWNQWQQLPGVHSTYHAFTTAMASCFGPSWKQSILPLPANFALDSPTSPSPPPSQASTNSSYNEVLQYLQHPLSWNDWQTCLSKGNLSSSNSAYKHLMQLTSGSTWPTRIKPITPQTLHLQATHTPLPHSRKLRL